MSYIFYADVYFLQNLLIKIAVLYLSLYCNKKRIEITRIRGLLKLCLVAGMGTIIEIAGLLMITSYNMFVIGVHLFEVPFMVWLVLRKEKQRRIKVIIAGYFFTMIINGILEILWNQYGEHGSYLFYLIFSCGTVIVGVRIWCNYSQMKKGIYRVEISDKGRLYQTNAFYDSGNQLRDPYTGKGVQIVSIRLLERFQRERGEPVYIPYQALGNDTGMLEVYYIDELIIEGECERITIQNCPMGVTKDNLFEGKNYEIILNEEVF